MAASTVRRRGIAASVTRIIPVLYSLLTASTAMTATIAWPTWTPVRLSLAGSGLAAAGRAGRGGVGRRAHRDRERDDAEQQPAGAGQVRSLVHSACSASANGEPSATRAAWLTRPAGAAGRRPGPGPPPSRRTAPRNRPTAPAGNTQRRRCSWPATCVVLRRRLLEGEGGGRGDPQQPVGEADRHARRGRQEVRDHDVTITIDDRGGAAAHHGADGEGEDGGDRDQRRRADDHAHFGRPRLREQVDALAVRYVRCR